MSARMDVSDLLDAVATLRQKRTASTVDALTAHLLERLAYLIENPPVEYLDEFNLPQFPDARVLGPAVDLARAITARLR